MYISRGVRLKFDNKLYYFVTFTNSVDPDEMQHRAAFHLGLHCLQKYPKYKMLNNKHRHRKRITLARSAVRNVSDYICVSDCRSRGREFDLSLSHTFVEIGHTIISTVILLPSADLIGWVVVSYKRKYVHEVLVNRLF